MGRVVNIPTVEHAAYEIEMSKSSESECCRGRAGAGPPWSMFPTSSSEKKQSSTLNHKPQLSPQHRHHHDEVRKNGISYAVGLMRSIAYCRIRLVNMKRAIVANRDRVANWGQTHSMGINMTVLRFPEYSVSYCYCS